MSKEADTSPAEEIRLLVKKSKELKKAGDLTERRARQYINLAGLDRKLSGEQNTAPRHLRHQVRERNLLVKAIERSRKDLESMGVLARPRLIFKAK